MDTRLAAALLAALALPCFADPPAADKRPAGSGGFVEKAGRVPSEAEQKADAIAECGSEKTAQKAREAQLGWGSVKHACRIAKKAGKPVDAIVLEFKSGSGWGKLRKKYGLTPGQGAAAQQPEKKD